MFRLLLALPLLLAATTPTPDNAPPAALAPYIHDGTFDPGDYRWLRGAFDGASMADKATNGAIIAWRKRCRTADLEHTRVELTEMGITAGQSLDTIPYRTLLCSQVASLPEDMGSSDWDGFVRDVVTVRPIAQGFLAAVTIAERSAEPATPGLREALSTRAIGEQTLRRGLEWASGGEEEAATLTLTPRQRGILAAYIAIAMAARDHANTEWLKGVVAAQGWPRRSAVGDAAARTAWLLVQHADADPAFQARALRLMEPLVANGEVSAKDYAYLYDRVMLKLVGKQRYATQLTCAGGRFVPQPLEDAKAVDAWRHKAGMDSFPAYIARAAKVMGPCAAGSK